MPLARRRARFVVGGLGAALLAALPLLGSRTEAPAADRTAAPPATPLVAQATVTPARVSSPARKAHASAPRTVEAAKPAAAPLGRHASGMLIFLDPETGQLLPTPRTALELESVSPALPRTADENLQIINLGRHGTGVVLDETFEDVSIIRLDASGRLRLDCMPGSDVAKALRAAPAPATVEK